MPGLDALLNYGMTGIGTVHVEPVDRVGYYHERYGMFHNYLLLVHVPKQMGLVSQHGIGSKYH